MMAVSMTLLSSMYLVATSAATSHSSNANEERNALLNENIDTDEVSFLQAGVQVRILKAEERISTKEESSDSAEACESLDKPYGSVDTSSDRKQADAFDEQYWDIKAQVAPTALPDKVSELTVEEEPYGAFALKATLELMIVILLIDGLRRWRLQQQEKESPEKARDSYADADAAADNAWEELVRAAALGDEMASEKALREKVPIRNTDMWGCTALHFAAVGGSAKVAGDLLKLGAEVDALDACDESALHFAARAGHSSICEVLLDNGANINLANSQDMTPLVVAGHAKQETTCRFIADHGGHAGGMADEDLPPLVICQVMRKVLEAA